MVSNACESVVSEVAVVGVCAADFNCDGRVDREDYEDFVAAFETGDARSDFDGDGAIDFFDYDGFVRASEAGC